MVQRSITASLVGMRHHGFVFADAAPIPAAQIELRRDPANPHDANAIAVRIGGRMAGYVDRASAAILAPILDAGRSCTVGALTVSNPTASAIPLAITLSGASARPPAPALPESAGIYEIVTGAGSERYVGQARHINERLKRHWDDLSLGIHANPLLQSRWRGCSGASFDATVLECAPPDMSDLQLARWLIDRERHWLEEHRRRFTVLNRVPPEIMLTPAAKLEAAREGEAARAARKQQRSADRERYAAIRPELAAAKARLDSATASIAALQARIRRASGIRGVLFASDSDRSTLPSLVGELDALQQRETTLQAEYRTLCEEQTRLRRILHPGRRPKYPAAVQVDLIFARARHNSRPHWRRHS